MAWWTVILTSILLVLNRVEVMEWCLSKLSSSWTAKGLHVAIVGGTHLNFRSSIILRSATVTDVASTLASIWILVPIATLIHFLSCA